MLPQDNGSEFAGEFERACQKFELEQYYSRVRTPKDNAVGERFNRTVREEFLDLGNFTTDILFFNRNLTEWILEYNFIRPHQSLGHLTPWKFYRQTPKVKQKRRKVLK